MALGLWCRFPGARATRRASRAPPPKGACRSYRTLCYNQPILSHRTPPPARISGTPSPWLLTPSRPAVAEKLASAEKDECLWAEGLGFKFGTLNYFPSLKRMGVGIRFVMRRVMGQCLDSFWAEMSKVGPLLEIRPT